MKVGDRIVVSSAHAGEVQRTGEILEIDRADGHVHYRVLWSDSHESLFFPAAGTVVRVVEQPHAHRVPTRHRVKG